MKKAGYKIGKEIFIALDVAASEFYDQEKKQYVFKKSDGSKRNAEELVAYYAELAKKYPIISIEDGCAENDWDGWKKLTDEIGANMQLVGDDLFVTNVKFLQQGHRHRRGQFDPRQSEPDRLAHRDARRHRTRQGKQYTAVISHRSGETEDATIADIAVATNAGQIKTGSLSRTDRVAKYNQLLRIEEELGDNAVYGGKMR